MNRPALMLIAVIPATFVLFLAGPRPDASFTVSEQTLPHDLDAWLTESESAFPDLKAQTEKTIVWHDPETRAKTPLAIVYLHGFSSSRQDVRPLPEQVARRLGANLYHHRFAGHGRGDDAMTEATLDAWIGGAVEAVAIGRRLGERVVLMGTSTGATAATWVAANRDRQDLAALVLVSPNYGPVHPLAPIVLWPWGTQIAELVEGDYRSWTATNPGQERFWTTRYPTRAVVPMMQLVELTTESNLEGVTTPVLTFYSPRDTVVDVAAVKVTFNRFGGPDKRLVEVTDAGDPRQHVLAGDILSPETTTAIADAIVAFLPKP